MLHLELVAKYLDGEFKLKGEFLSGNSERTSVLTRSEKYAGWTLPTVFPDEELDDNDEMQHDYQSVGAQAVTNLANKIMMALFQPAKPFFRMQLTEQQKVEIAGAGMLSGAEVDAALAETERNAMRELDKLNARVSLIDMIQQLIIVGNSLVYMPDDGKMQIYSLRDYVIDRDLAGNTVKMVLRETKVVSSLSDELASIAAAAGFPHDKEVSIYTGIQRIENGRFVVWQEMEDLCYCHKRLGLWTEDTLPWIPQTWNRARGKDYGTGLVESYSGDFHSLSTLAEAILDYTTVITDVKNLVNPAGMTNVRELTEAPSGAYVHGREEDIFSYSADVKEAAQFLEARFSAVERRLGAAFLLSTSVTRDAERVTAEEIRMQAQELESSLGGVYSRLATELQLPLAKRILRKLNPTFKDIDPIIVTGFESLSRNSELGNFRAFMADLASLAELPDEIKARMMFGDIIAILGAGHGVDYKKFLKDEEVVKSETQQRIAENAQNAGQEAQAVAQAQGQAA